MTQRERLAEAVKLFATFVLAVPGALLLLALLGMIFEGAARDSENRDRCLKQATNGYEIQQCR